MLWKISILLTTYMNHPSVEKVQNWPEFLTRPWGQDDWHGNLQTISPLGVCSATLKGLLFYFESCWTLFLNLPCYMSDRPCIRRGTWITLVYLVSDRAAWRCVQMSVCAPKIQVNCCKVINSQTSGIYRPALGDGDKALDFFSILREIKARGHICQT